MFKTATAQETDYIFIEQFNRRLPTYLRMKVVLLLQTAPCKVLFKFFLFSNPNARQRTPETIHANRRAAWPSDECGKYDHDSKRHQCSEPRSGPHIGQQ